MERSFEYHTANICYNKFGSGQTIVLLHGFGEDSRIFENQVSFLQDNYTIIVPDLPGSGKSELLNIPGREVAIEDYAELIKYLLDFEKISSCILLGHSMGGYITLAFAEKYPEWLLAFGLIHSSAASDTADKKKNRKQGIEMISQYGAFSFLKNTIPNLFAEGFKKSHPEVVSNLIEQSRQFTGEALIQYYTAMMNRDDMTEVLLNTSLPVLFILGNEDVAAPLDVVINQAHLTSISHIHILQNVAHMGMLEATDDMNTYLDEFVRYVTES